MAVRHLLALLGATLLLACHEPEKDGVAPPTDDDTVDTDPGGDDTDPTWGDTDTDGIDTDVVDTDTDVDPVDTDSDTGWTFPPDTSPPPDTAPPVLEVFEPAHGSWLPAGPVEVYGEVHDDDLVSTTVNGEVMVVDTDGSFASTGAGGPGIVIVESEAVDAKGHRSTDARAAMVGEELPAGQPLDDALLVRLDEGEGGIDTIEQLAQGLITPDAIGGMIPNPVIDQSSQSCFTIPFVGTQCITWYALRLNVNDVTFGDFVVDLDPKAAGNLLATVTVNGLDIDWNATGTVAGIGQSFSGHMTADAVIVTLDVTPYVDANGALQVTVNGSSVQLQNFQAGLPGWITDVAGFFGIDVDQIVLDQIQSQLDAVLRDQLPSLLSGALGSLAQTVSIDVAGARLDLAIALSSIVVDEVGLTLGLELGVSAVPDLNPDTGSLFVGWGAPSFPGAAGARVAISMDAVNQLLRGAWAAGIANVDTLLGGGGGTTFDLSLLVPGAADAQLAVASPLPFVMVPRDAAHGEIQIGDLDLRLVHADQTPILDAWTSLRAEVSASMTGGTIALQATPLQIAVHVEGTVGHRLGLGLEDFFELLVQELVPGLLQTIGAFPIPTIAGFGLADTTVTFDGPEHGYLLVTGKLAAVPPPAPAP